MASDTSLGLAVNYAVQRLGSMRSWPWLYSEQTANTTANTAALTLPATASRIHFVAIGDDVLDRRQRADLFRRSDTTSNQQPREWAPKGSAAVVLSPTPDAIYTVNFGLTLIEPVLSNASDTPLLPAQFHDLIVLLAARYIATRKKDSEMIQALTAEINDWLPDLHRAAVSALSPTPIRTRQDW